MPSEEYEKYKKRTIKTVQKGNYCIRIVDQTDGTKNERVFYQELARLLFERALKKSK
ncbi:hypothetical protein BUN12_1272 [Bacillus amyloliquefaciens]|nr:SPBc2 prophage-derived uncharacterized protein yotN [Bacillus amyloliquefaciens LL3]AEK88598.1 hypothetical protein; SPbeta phage [Bacillus amyloliquefaciens XH7]AIW33958.1 hypothetical protein KS08_10000 [Bacillus subtilis]ARW39324.1 hypothetical protein S101267_02237 [Bacillus amyloliquefaciens]AZV89532.1 hypothetical protein BUN12_1272 [Bacillus amyloliquefaciens]